MLGIFIYLLEIGEMNLQMKFTLALHGSEIIRNQLITQLL